MKILSLAVLALLAACSPSSKTGINDVFTSQPGLLFCSIQLAGGGAVVTTLTAAALSSAVPGAAPLVVIATNAGKDAVDKDCTEAARVTPGGVSGSPVVPQAITAPPVAIVSPASPVVSAK